MNETGQQWQGQIVAGKFELRAYLGGSEYGCVFATDRGGEPAAIKLIQTKETQAGDHPSRWEQTAHLSHPHLVRLFETGRCRIGDADLVYVVMERADEALAEILPERALTPEEAGKMLPPILDALAYLHGQGLVHGSIKPANILAVGEQVKISSDGIRPIGAPQRRLSVYDAPETGCSAAADVWSLGITLAQVLTQQLPRSPESDPDDPFFSAPLPQPFLDIVRNCLERNPESRWTIQDIAARCGSSVHPWPVQETELEARRETPAAGATATWRLMVPGIALIVLAVMVIFVAPKIKGHFQNRQREVLPPETAPAAQKMKKTAPPEQQTARPDTRSQQAKSPALKEPNLTTTPMPEAVVDTAAESETPPAESAWDQVAEQVVPEVPEKARDTIRGTVKVGIRVDVGPSGEVTAVNVESPGPSRYFANLAASAASRWKFVPTQATGSAQRTWILRFEFTQDATKVFPAVVHP